MRVPVFAGGGAINAGDGRRFDNGQVTGGPAESSCDDPRVLTWAIRPDVDTLEVLPATHSHASTEWIHRFTPA